MVLSDTISVVSGSGSRIARSQEWRNWQTRRLQVPVVVNIVWVQVPLPA